MKCRCIDLFGGNGRINGFGWSLGTRDRSRGLQRYSKRSSNLHHRTLRLHSRQVIFFDILLQQRPIALVIFFPVVLIRLKIIRVLILRHPTPRDPSPRTISAPFIVIALLPVLPPFFLILPQFPGEKLLNQNRRKSRECDFQIHEAVHDSAANDLVNRN